MKYPTLFQGIGKLRGVEVKLHIDEKINPVAQQLRIVPFHIRQKVEAELHEGIIEHTVETAFLPFSVGLAT